MWQPCYDFTNDDEEMGTNHYGCALDDPDGQNLAAAGRGQSG